MSPEPRHVLTLDLPAAHRGVRVARNLIVRFARLQGVDEEGNEALALVASELLANVIDHGGGEAALSEADLVSDVRMHLELEVRPERWVLSVTDRGGGEPEAVRRKLEEADGFDLEDDRGRGLFLMRAMVDELEVLANPHGDGLVLRATKSLRARSTSDPGDA